MTTQAPIIGTWYQDASDDEIFKVVAVDEDSGSVGIQSLDGEVSELDLDIWQQILLLPANPPEDWGASYDLSDEDSSVTDDVFNPNYWNNPLANLDSGIDYGYDDN